MSGSTQNIVIAVTATGVPVVQRGLQGIGQAAQQTAITVQDLQHALAALGIGLGVKELKDALDVYTNMINKLVAVGTSVDTLSGVYEKLKGVSRDTHNSLEATIGLYSRLTMGLKQLGYTENEVIDFTRQLSQAVKLSGVTNQEAKFAIQDLAHGLAAGTVNGRELNGILREMPSLAHLMAKALDKPVGQLKELATAGHITADALIKGFQRLNPEIAGEFARRTNTITDGITDIKTEFIDWIGKFAAANKVIEATNTLLFSMAANMDTVMKSILVLGAAFAIFYVLPAVIGTVTAALWAMAVAAAANPLLLLVAALGAAYTALQLFGDQINLGVDDVTTLKDMWKAFVETVAGPIWGDIAAGITDFFNSIQTGWGDTIAAMSAMDWLIAMARGLDIMMATFSAAWTNIKTGWAGVASFFPEMMFEAINAILAGVARMVQGVLWLIKPITLAAGLGNMAEKPPDLSISNPFAGATAQMLRDAKVAGEQVGREFQTALDGEGRLAAGMKGLVPTAQDIARVRILANPAAGGDLDIKPERHDPGAHGKKGVDKLQRELDQLENKWSRVLKAVNEYEKAVRIVAEATAAHKITPEQGAQLLERVRDKLKEDALGEYDHARKAASKLKFEIEDLNGFLKVGVITQEEFAHALEVAKKRAEDLVDPLGAVYRNLDRIRETAMLGTREQAVENEIWKEQQQLLTKGIILTDEMKAALRERLTTDQEDIEVMTKKNAVLDSLLNPMRDLAVGTKALNDLQAEGKITAGEYTTEMLKLKYASLQGKTDIGSGVERGLIKTMQDGQDMAGQMERVFTGAFEGMAEAMVQFAKTGKLSFKAVADMVVSEITRMIVKWLMFKALQGLGIGGGSGGASGGSDTIGNIIGIARSIVGFAGGISGLGGGESASAGMDMGNAVKASMPMNTLGAAATGAEFRVGGAGGVDSRLVAFRASPDEVVTVRRPDQFDGEGPAGTGRAPAAPPQIKIINSISPEETLRHMASSQGEQVILNVIQRNPQAVRQATRN